MCPAGRSQSALRGCAWAGNRDSSVSSRASMDVCTVEQSSSVASNLLVVCGASQIGR